MKFKKGDICRVIGNGCGITHYLEVPSIVVVVEDSGVNATFVYGKFDDSVVRRGEYDEQFVANTQLKKLTDDEMANEVYNIPEVK